MGIIFLLSYGLVLKICVGKKATSCINTQTCQGKGKSVAGFRKNMYQFENYIQVKIYYQQRRLNDTMEYSRLDMEPKNLNFVTRIQYNRVVNSFRSLKSPGHVYAIEERLRSHQKKVRCNHLKQKIGIPRGRKYKQKLYIS